MSYTSELASFPSGGKSFAQMAKDAITKVGHIPVEMRDFSASPHTPAAVCRALVANSDLFVAIVGFQYGSPVQEFPKMSYTEYEFNVAASCEIPRFVFLLGEESELPARLTNDYENGAKQQAFRRRIVTSGITTKTIMNPYELKLEIVTALSREVLANVGEKLSTTTNVEERPSTTTTNVEEQPTTTTTNVEEQPSTSMAGGAVVLPFYLVLDVSDAMKGSAIAEANRILPQIADTVAINPILSDKVRFSAIGYADIAHVMLPMCDIADQRNLPQLFSAQDSRSSAEVQSS